MKAGMVSAGLLACVLLMIGGAAAAQLEIVPSGTDASAPRRSLLAKLEVSNAALKLARAIMDAEFYEVLNVGTKKPKLTCPAGATGIITWDKGDKKKHIMAETFPTGAVAFSTGNVSLATAFKYDAALDKSNSSGPSKSDKITNAYDLCVLDFWVKTKEIGGIYLNSYFATLEGSKAVAAKHAAGVKADDTFHIEITEANGDVYMVSRVFEANTPMTWLNFKDTPDHLKTTKMAFPDYTPVDIAEYGFVDKDAEYRIKIRVADVGDGLVDSVAYIQMHGFSMIPNEFR